MAIQIWDEQAQQYKGVELARFGDSGTLKEALVWDGTKYVKVWPNTPAPLWEDDFTGPTLHERWTDMGGALVGPEVGETFEITFTAGPGGAEMWCYDLSGDTGVMVDVSASGSVALTVAGVATVGMSDPGTVTGPVTLRRVGSDWSVLHGGQVVVSSADFGSVPLAAQFTPTEPLVIVLGAYGGTVTFISYTEL